MSIITDSGHHAFRSSQLPATTIQPKVGLNVSTIGDNDWKAGFAAGAELQYQATDNLGVAVGALYSVQGFKAKDVKVAGMTFEGGKWNPFELLPSSWSCSQGRFAARFPGKQG